MPTRRPGATKKPVCVERIGWLSVNLPVATRRRSFCWRLEIPCFGYRDEVFEFYDLLRLLNLFQRRVAVDFRFLDFEELRQYLRAHEGVLNLLHDLGHDSLPFAHL